MPNHPQPSMIYLPPSHVHLDVLVGCVLERQRLVGNTFVENVRVNALVKVFVNILVKALVRHMVVGTRSCSRRRRWRAKIDV
jgi:hypothetical protein